MRKAIALVVVVIMMLIMAVLGTYVALILVGGSATVTDRYFSDAAFYVAEGGMLYILSHEFDGDSDWSDNSPPPAKTLGKGSFVAEYENQAPGAVDLIVTGTITDQGRNYIRKQKLHLVMDSPEGPVSDYVQYVAGNITMNNASGNVTGDIAAGNQANVGASVIISGDLEEGAPIQIPAMDWDYYKQKAQEKGNYIDGNVTISSGTYGTNSPGQGEFYYVTGTVTIRSDVTFYGTIVCEGNINASGRDTISVITVPLDIDDDGTAEDMPVLASTGQTNFNNADGVTINGLVYSLQGANFNATDLDFTGALVIDGNLNMNNATDIVLTYDSSLLNDLEGFEQTGSAGTLIISQWQEIA